MRVLVTGCGRGGTNWVTEFVCATGLFRFTSPVEDRGFFLRDVLPERYGTKLATENQGFTVDALKKQIQAFRHLHVVFAFRHPVDIAMAKIYRGRPFDGDAMRGKAEPADTVETAVKAIRRMVAIYNYCDVYHTSRTVVVRLEDLILDIDRPIQQVCRFFRCEPTPAMRVAHTFIRNPYQQKRYGGKVNRCQVGLHQRWESVYDGYFSDKPEVVKTLISELKSECVQLGYYGWRKGA